MKYVELSTTDLKDCLDNCIKNGLADLNYIGSACQKADMSTKLLRELAEWGNPV